MSSHSLFAFDSNAAPPITITVALHYQFPHLCLEYGIFDPKQQIKFPQPELPPQRRHQLWQHTCYEFFLAIANGPEYWEFNLSPSHHWNCYHFQSYRRAMAEEQAWQNSPFTAIEQEFKPAQAMQTMEFRVDLSRIMPQPQPLQLGIATVMENQAGAISYWALEHGAGEADFHHRPTWVINL